MSKKFVSSVEGPRQKNPTSTLVRDPSRTKPKNPPKKLRRSRLALLAIDSTTRVLFHPMTPQMSNRSAQAGLAQITRQPSHAVAGEARSKIENNVACLLFIETLLSKSLSRKRVEPKGQMTPFGSSQPADWGKVLVSL